MANSPDPINDIDENIQSGASKVVYNDKEASFRSLDDLLRIKILTKAAITGRQRSSRRYGVYFKNE